MTEGLKTVSVEEAIRQLDKSIAESEPREYAFSERIALRLEANEASFGWPGKTTTERAIDVLEYPEKFPPYYLLYALKVAKAWLKSDPAARIFKKISG